MLKSKKVKWLAVIAATIAGMLITAVLTILVSDNLNHKKNIRLQMELGEQYLAGADFNRAAIYFERVIELDKKNEQAYLQLAGIYREMEDYELLLEMLVQSGDFLPASASLQAELSQAQDLYAAWQQAKAESESEFELEAVFSETINEQDGFQTDDDISTDTVDFGWIPDNQNWWYRFEDGNYPANDWLLVDENWYFFNEDGYMQAGWIEWNSMWYFTKDSGEMIKDTFIEYEGNMYYFDEEGACINP